MIHRYEITHLDEDYWSVHHDILVGPAYAGRVVEEALFAGDWILAREWAAYERVPGWMPVGGAGDVYPDRCFTEREFQKLIQRGYWRKITDLAVGQSMTVPLILY